MKIGYRVNGREGILGKRESDKKDEKKIIDYHCKDKLKVNKINVQYIYVLYI